jgi:hypothetical protein
MPDVYKLVWVILMAGLVGLLYFAFRGYLAPSFLIDFANSLLCHRPAPIDSAALTVFSINIATVIGPTPPGTGVR